MKILQKQKGVFRVSCLDCLNRTNIFMTALAVKTLEMQLNNVGIPMTSLL